MKITRLNSLMFELLYRKIISPRDNKKQNIKSYKILALIVTDMKIWLCVYIYMYIYK